MRLKSRNLIHKNKNIFNFIIKFVLYLDLIIFLVYSCDFLIYGNLITLYLNPRLDLIMYNKKCLYTSSYINTISISSDGKKIAAGNNDGIYFFNIEVNFSWNYLIHKKILSISISEDGKFIVAGSFDGKVYFFNSSKPSPKWTYSTNSTVSSVVMSRDGRFTMVGNSDGKVYFFNNSKPSPEWIYSTNGPVNSIAISKNGRFMVIGNSNGKIFYFTNSKSIPKWIYPVNSSINDVELSQDGMLIIAGSSDFHVYLLNGSDSKCLLKYETKGIVKNVAISQNNQFITAISNDNRLYIFNIVDYELVYLYKIKYYNKYNSTPLVIVNNNLIITSLINEPLFLYWDELFHTWNYQKGFGIWCNYLFNLPLIKDYITHIKSSEDGNYVIIASNSGIIYLYERYDIPGII